MNKKFTKLIAALALLVFMMPTMVGWGQATTYTSNVTLSTSGGTEATIAKVIINSTQYDAIKLGKNGKGGSFNISIPSGTTQLYVHCTRWKGKNTTLTLSTSASGVSISPTGNWTLVSDDALTGTTTSFNLSCQACASSDYFKAYTLSGVNQNVTITITANDERAVVWGVNTATGAITPTIAFTGTTTYNATYTGTGSSYQTFAGTYSGLENNPSFAVAYYSSAEATTELTGDDIPDWLSVTAYNNSGALGGQIYVYLNEGGERHAYFKVYSGTTYSSNVYTVNQAASPAPTVTLSGTSATADYAGNVSGDAITVSTNLTGNEIAYSAYYNNDGTYSPANPYDDWFEASVNNSNEIVYTVLPNTTGAERIAQFKINAIDDNYEEANSEVITFTQTPVGAPTFAPDGGTFHGTQSVTINPGVTDASIIYTLDGSDPTTSNGTPYTGPFSITEGKTVKAINYVVVDGATCPSTVVSATFTQEQVATPTFSPAAGAVVSGTSITINCTTAEAAIHYTTDGSTPTTSSTIYTEAITVNADMTIKAIAVKDGYINSEMAMAAYTILTVTNIATARAAAVDQTVSTMGIVTYNSSNSTLYIQDETAAIRIYGENLNYSTGTQIAVSGTIAMHNETKQIINPTISVLSTGNDLPYMVKSIEDINTDNYTNFQNLRVQIVEATVISKTGSGNNTNTTIKQGENSLLVYGSMSGVSVNDVITLKGFVYLYNSSTLEITNPTDVVVKPTLTAADMNMNWNETSKTRVVTVNHPVSGSELIAATEAEWLSLSVSENNVTVTTTVNTGAERSATILLDYIKEGETLADSSFTVTQAGKPTMCTVSFNINGVVAMTAEVPTGTALDLSNFTAPVTSDTYSFAGWSASASEISVISTYTPVSGVTEATLYAVYSAGGGNYEKITSTDDLTDGDYLIVYEAGAVAFNGSLTTLDATSNTVSVNINENVIAETATLNNSCFTIEAVTGGYSIKSASGFYIGRQAKSNGITTSTTTVYVNNIEISSNNILKISNYYASESLTNYLKYNSASDQARFRYYTSDSQKDIALYKKVAGSYITNLSGVPTIVNIPSTIVVTVKSRYAVNITGTNNGYPASLIIEDGAQLIANSAVQASVQKEIAGFGSDNSVRTGWYTIASPTTSNITPAGNMLENTYDLYYYDETDVKWYNYKQNTAETNQHANFSIVPNTGYLYANSVTTTLNFAGEVRPYNASVSIPLSYASENDDLIGFNLVGNPFTYNLDSETNILLGEVNLSSYYIADGTVSDGKNLIACEITDRPIKPCEGFFVQAMTDGQSLVFNGRGRSEQKGYIRIAAGNEAFMDSAYVQIGGGNTLRKMTLSDNTAKVYVMQGNEDYAAVTVEEAQGEMPVNFRANENGTYTLTVNPENVEMNYLHLIDNMTGADIDLLQTPSYSFNANVTDYESRFKLVFATNNEDGASTGSATFAFYSNGNWIINNPSTGSGPATLQVVDITGRILSSETVNGSVSTTINATPGVYMLRLINGENVKVQKIVVR